MAAGFVYDEAFLNHRTGPHHPERPARLLAILEGLKTAGLWERLVHIRPRPAERRWLLTAHSGQYLQRLEAACRRGLPYIDVPDSQICRDSYEVAVLAAGAGIAGVDAVMSGQVRRAFCAVRPPGHHAEYDASLGFCLLNNVVIAVNYLRETYGVQRILILDWDVHHGNGTQHAFESDPDVFYCSIHQDPRTCYPGTGYAAERGTGPGLGTTLNLPMAAGSSDAEYRKRLESEFLPAAEKFRPQFVFVSVGFDPHRDDSLAAIELSDDGFDWMTQMICDLADRFADGRLVSILEGGYNLSVLHRCAAKHVEIMLNGCR